MRRQQKEQEWKGQQKGQVQCSTCGQYVPRGNYPIHAVRCSYKKQSKIKQQKISQLSQPQSHSVKRKGISRVQRRYKIFPKKQSETKQDEQQRIPCSFCGYRQSLCDLDTHPANCQGRQDVCAYCGQMYPKQLMHQHESVCPENDDSDEFGSMGQQQDEEEQSYSTQQRRRQSSSSQPSSLNNLMGLLQLIDNMRVNMNVLLRDIQVGQESQGLSQQKLNRLRRFKYKQCKQQQQLCTICYCKMQTGEQCLQLICKHIYHRECITKWLQQSSKCPVCKRDQAK